MKTLITKQQRPYFHYCHGMGFFKTSIKDGPWKMHRQPHDVANVIDVLRHVEGKQPKRRLDTTDAS
jgi:hypothetical protein